MTSVAETKPKSGKTKSKPPRPTDSDRKLSRKESEKQLASLQSAWDETRTSQHRASIQGLLKFCQDVQELKGRTVHGEWKSVLKACDINADTAGRLQNIASSWLPQEIPTFGQLLIDRLPTDIQTLAKLIELPADEAKKLLALPELDDGLSRAEFIALVNKRQESLAAQGNAEAKKKVEARAKRAGKKKNGTKQKAAPAVACKTEPAEVDDITIEGGDETDAADDDIVDICGTDAASEFLLVCGALATMPARFSEADLNEFCAKREELLAAIGNAEQALAEIKVIVEASEEAGD